MLESPDPGLADATTRKEVSINYPPPKTTKHDAKSIPFDLQTAQKNKKRKLTGKLPLLANKKDRYGIPYTDIPTLMSQLGYNFTTIKDYKFSSEKTDVYENNNSGGKSKRFDMKATFMPQFEYTIKLKNESNNDDEETSLKDGGPHPSNKPSEINRADCFIILLENDGRSICTQLEPSHMDVDPHGYGGLFNKVKFESDELPRLAGRKYALRFIKLNDLANKRVIGIVAIDLLDGNGFKLIYLTEVYDGMGGYEGNGVGDEEKKKMKKDGRGLKDPYRQWVKTALNIKEECTITVRMDAQPQTNIQRGVHYDNARITEIVDYEQ
jgi:hypothetical protein